MPIFSKRSFGKKKKRAYHIAITGASVSNQAIGYVDILRKEFMDILGASKTSQFCYPCNRLSDGGLVRVNELIKCGADICIIEPAYSICVSEVHSWPGKDEWTLKSPGDLYVVLNMQIRVLEAIANRAGKPIIFAFDYSSIIRINIIWPIDYWRGTLEG